MRRRAASRANTTRYERVAFHFLKYIKNTVHLFSIK